MYLPAVFFKTFFADAKKPGANQAIKQLFKLASLQFVFHLAEQLSGRYAIAPA